MIARTKRCTRGRVQAGIESSKALRLIETKSKSQSRIAIEIEIRKKKRVIRNGYVTSAGFAWDSGQAAVGGDFDCDFDCDSRLRLRLRFRRQKKALAIRSRRTEAISSGLAQRPETAMIHANQAMHPRPGAGRHAS